MRVMKLQWSPINPPFKMPTDPPHSPSGSMISSSMLIHFWEARKNVKGGPCIFLEIEMLMIDEEGTLAQGFIGQNLRNQYEKELERGSIYTLTKFYASNSKVMYHVADQKLVICISHVSALSKVEENIEGILTERFRSIHFQILKPTAISEGIFTMLLATLSWSMVSLSISVRFCAPRMTQLLGELCGPVMNIYLWDEAAENFCLKFDACAATPTVLLITTVNPKRLGGKLRLSSMSYSRVFLDEEVDSPKEYLTWLKTAKAMKEEATSRNGKRKRQRNPKTPKEEPNETPKNQNNDKKRQRDTKTHKSNQHGGSSALSKRPKPSNFLDTLREKLSGGNFRRLNEKLYTCSGKEALDYFNEDPTLFDMYHTGYQQQMTNWPELPVNSIISWLSSRSSSLVVADFGCGDARIAKSVKNKVFSFDLVSKDPSVIACDMSNTPLESSSVDVAVFCLSLMGTNYSSYIKEAHRVLRPSGWLLIAEVKSRFDPNNGGADPKDFVKAVSDLGFSSSLKDFSNKMFILLHFKKKEQLNSNKKKIEWPELKACLYKRR
ncbi:unnamed protein product [Brassica rapa]|uniref:Ribosomal RNA-processing protein 8 n=3 Tax=Brassica campestris TaxID=3711 RepID=A0A8D9HVD0_BRACM|nr:unnamed protein product [Brassica rapa]